MQRAVSPFDNKTARQWWKQSQCRFFKGKQPKCALKIVFIFIQIKLKALDMFYIKTQMVPNIMNRCLRVSRDISNTDPLTHVLAYCLLK